MLDWSQCPAVETNPGKVNGAWLFKGTRIPIKALFENLEDGVSVADFLKWFPGVTREQVDAVLEYQDHAALHQAMAALQEDIKAGRLIDAEEVLRELRRVRTPRLRAAQEES